MSEEGMVAVMQAALDHHGINDKVEVVGQFNPRGQSGSTFAGLVVGEDLGSLGGSVGGDIGGAAGMLGAWAANAKSRGLPQKMLVGASATMVYGAHSETRHTEPDYLVFVVPRAGLTVNIHQRVNVRVLELVHEATGAKIELEGSRIPLTHTKDVMGFLATAD